MNKKLLINDRNVFISLYDIHTLSYKDLVEIQNDINDSAINIDGNIYIYNKSNNYITDGHFIISHNNIVKFSAIPYASLGTLKYVDISNKDDLKSYLKNSRINSEELDYNINSSADAFRPVINTTDLPEMIGLKKAVIKKNIDIDKYSERFGENYNNDRRLFKKSSITLTKLKSICEALDVDLYLTFKDKPNCINPMNDTIKVKITNIGELDDTE